MFQRILSPAFVLALFTLGFCLIASAQDLDDVTITGKITDSNGLAVVGASVTATSVERGESRTVVTNDEGVYQIVKLKPGTYKIKATGSGFGVQETTPIKTISAMGISGFSSILSVYRDRAPLRRNVDASEVGEAAAFLLSDAGKAISVEVLIVDAGFHVTGM